MKLETKRLYISNLPENISEEDLQSKFTHYGKIASIEIKERKNVTGNQTPRFAYIQLDINNEQLEYCLNEFSNTKWKGYCISIQIAKESFMERLKREREEVKYGEIIHNTNDSKEVYKDHVDTIVNNQLTTSNHSHIASFSKGSKSIANKVNLHKRNNTNELLNNDEQKADEIQSVPCIKETPQEIQSNTKRLESIKNMKYIYHQQKLLVKNALSSIDTTPKNKILFEEPTLSNYNNTVTNNSIMDHKKISLFEADDDNSEEYNFEIREQFQGQKGQKLMELQSRFKYDKRFTLDSRFAECSDEEKELAEDCAKHNMYYKEEKQKEYEILEKVLGKKIDHKHSTKRRMPDMMLRYDPTVPEHAKYEVTSSTSKSDNKKKCKNQNPEKNETVTVQSPVVSKETFYKVTNDLKDTLHQKETFSLANLFNNEIIDEKQDEHVEKSSTIIKPHKHSYEENPFKYDSSSDEEDNNKTQQLVPKLRLSKNPNKIQGQGNKPTKLWTESFFFKTDDYRLQEGLDFIKRLEVNDLEDFSKLRRTLKGIVKAKIKNNQRKNSSFKNKLGGKKRLRIKRAMKR